MSNAKAAPRQRALPLSDWPPADRDAWLAATASSGLLGDAGIASHLAPSTRDDLTRRYAYFLAFAKRTGRLVSEGPPACNVTEDAITAYVQDLEEYASSVTVHGSVIKAMRVAECVAPQMDWLWLRVLCRRLETRMIGRNKRPRMVDVGRLLDLGTCSATVA